MIFQSGVTWLVEESDPLAALSKRERLIAERFAEGLTYRQIGEALGIAPSTVRTHIAAIYRKLEISNKAALVRIWTTWGDEHGRVDAMVGQPVDAVASEPQAVASDPAGISFDADRQPWRATVLVCEVRANSRLGTDTDSDDQQDQIAKGHKLCRESLARAGGFVVSSSDVVVQALFSYPTAQQDDADRAARAALDLIDTVAQAEMRLRGSIDLTVGIATGGVFVDKLASDAVALSGDALSLATELQGCAKPGQILIAEETRRLLEGDFAFSEFGGGEVVASERLPQMIALTGERVSQGSSKEVNGVQPLPGRLRTFAPTRVILGFAAVLAIIVVGVGWLSAGSDFDPMHPDDYRLTLPEKPSIAVLPFKNLGDQEDGDFLVDGLTEDITTDLSKVSGLFVISRNTSLKYKGDNVDIQKLAKDLGVRYVLSGSVRQSEDQIRVSAQLVDTMLGNQVWANRYDRKVDDVFDLQSEVSQRVVESLAVKLTSREKGTISHVPTTNLQARAAFLKGLSLINPPAPANLARARKSFQEAINFDPNYAGGYSGIAFVDAVLVMFAKGIDFKKINQMAIDMAKKAIDIDPDFGFSYTALAFAYFNEEEYDLAIQTALTGIELEPSNADTHAFLGLFRALGGEPDLAVEDVRRAIRLAPRYVGPYFNFLGYASFQARRYAEAVAAYEENDIRRGPKIHISLAFWAASYAMDGQLENGRNVVAEIVKMYPGISLTNWPSEKVLTVSFKDTADRAHLEQALSMVGFPGAAK